MQALKRLLGRRQSSVEVSESRGVRTLHLGGDAIQSAIRLTRPDELELAYTRAMMAFLLVRPAPRDIVMVGLGGGSIARFVHARMSRARMTVVEINPKVVAAARTFFGLPPDDERLAVVIADGGTYVPSLDGSVDVLLLDAFHDGVSVPSLATQGFYDAAFDALRDGGVLVVNFIADEPRFGTYLARIEEAFSGRVLCLPSEDGVNLIVIAVRRGPSRIGIEPLRRHARELKAAYGLPFDVFAKKLLDTNERTNAYLKLGRAED